MARNARRLATLGVALMGGCCGTTPEHIAEISRRVRAYRPRPLGDPLFSPLLAA